MNYIDQIKSGNWQRKRLEIFQRDKFQCRVCGEETNIQVHHLYYIPNMSIWEYDNEAMVTVCKYHHELLNKELPKLSGIIAFEILTGLEIGKYKEYYKIF